MTTFLARVELHHENDYKGFHEAMERRGFRRTIWADGKLKDLPTGTYTIDPSFGIHAVVVEILGALREVCNFGKIVVSGGGDISTACLDEHVPTGTGHLGDGLRLGYVASTAGYSTATAQLPVSGLLAALDRRVREQGSEKPLGLSALLAGLQPKKY